MEKLATLRAHLKEGQLYRRADVAGWSKSPDRHLTQLVKEGTLEKVYPGLYHYPATSVFGHVPAGEKELVRKFLKDDRFLVTSPNVYNSLGVGTTQLYNERVVYNHKRHGDFVLDGRRFAFRSKHHFPAQLTPEFLLVDLVNQLDTLAEDKGMLLEKVRKKAHTMGARKLARAVKLYGNVSTKKWFEPLLAKTA